MPQESERLPGCALCAGAVCLWGGVQRGKPRIRTALGPGLGGGWHAVVCRESAWQVWALRRAPDSLTDARLVPPGLPTAAQQLEVDRAGASSERL